MISLDLKGTPLLAITVKVLHQTETVFLEWPLGATSLVLAFKKSRFTSLGDKNMYIGENIPCRFRVLGKIESENVLQV